jgi:hypothetical protein
MCTKCTNKAEQVSNRYPDEERCDEKIGSKHIVIKGDSNFEVGDIVTLITNDGSLRP